MRFRTDGKATPGSRDALSCTLWRISHRIAGLCFLIVVLANVFAAWRAPAQTVDGRAIDGGPPGGSVEAIVLDRKDTTTLYAATNWSGVFKSTDGGENWTAINNGLADPLVSSLAISPADPAVVYAGTRSGVFKTVNGGSQ